MPLEPVALLVELDRLVERRLALFERAHDLLEPRSAASKLNWLTSVSALWPWLELLTLAAGSNQGGGYSTGVFLNGSRMPGTISSSTASPLRRGQRRFGVADMLLALGAQLLDQRLAVALEARVGRRGARRPPWPPWRRPRRARAGVVRPSVTGSLGVMFAMFQWLRSRIAAMVVRVVPISLLIWPSLTSGWFRMIQSMPSGLSWRLLTGV